MKILNWIKNNLLIAITVVTTVVATNWVSSLDKSDQKEIERLQNELAKKDSVTLVVEDSYRKASIRVNELDSENKKLNKQINKNDETIKSQTNIIASLSDSLNNVRTKIIYIPSDTSEFGIEARSFVADKGAFYIEGWFQITEPYNINFNKLQATVDFELSLSETDEGTWNTYLYSKESGVVVNSLETKYIPYSASWYKKVKLGTGIQISTNGYASLNALLGYNKIIGIVGISNYGMTFGFNYFITN